MEAVHPTGAVSSVPMPVPPRSRSVEPDPVGPLVSTPPPASQVWGPALPAAVQRNHMDPPPPPKLMTREEMAALLLLAVGG